MSGQSRRHSLLEAVANNAIAFGISVFAQWALFPLFGIAVSLAQNAALVTIFSLISIVRSYLLRRLFNAISLRRTT